MAGVGVLDPIGVFAKDGVAHPMQSIFDMPMPLPPFQKVIGRCLVARGAGDRIGRFRRRLSVANHTPREATNALMTWPIERAAQSRSDLQAIVGATPMPLGRLLREFTERLMPMLCVGGKIPLEIRRRSAL